MPYSAEKPGPPTDPDALRERIPGWGADLDPADRPAFPREQPGIVTGAHWHLPVQQAETRPRERSVEHERLTPVFGTAQPLHGPAGAIRRLAYARYSEGQTPHWMLLVLADRVDAFSAHVASLISRRPDQPFTQTGIAGEWGHRPVASRLRPGRVDGKHTWLDPILVVGPWVVTVWVGVRLVRAATRIVRSRVRSS